MVTWDFARSARSRLSRLGGPQELNPLGLATTSKGLVMSAGDVLPTKQPSLDRQSDLVINEQD